MGYKELVNSRGTPQLAAIDAAQLQRLPGKTLLEFSPGQTARVPSQTAVWAPQVPHLAVCSAPMLRLPGLVTEGRAPVHGARIFPTSVAQAVAVMSDVARAVLEAALRGVGLPASALANVLDDAHPRQGVKAASLLQALSYEGARAALQHAVCKSLH